MTLLCRSLSERTINCYDVLGLRQMLGHPASDEVRHALAKMAYQCRTSITRVDKMHIRPTNAVLSFMPTYACFVSEVCEGSYDKRMRTAVFRPRKISRRRSHLRQPKSVYSSLGKTSSSQLQNHTHAQRSRRQDIMDDLVSNESAETRTSFESLDIVMNAVGVR